METGDSDRAQVRETQNIRRDDGLIITTIATDNSGCVVLLSLLGENSPATHDG